MKGRRISELEVAAEVTVTDEKGTRVEDMIFKTDSVHVSAGGLTFEVRISKDKHGIEVVYKASKASGGARPTSMESTAEGAVLRVST